MDRKNLSILFLIAWVGLAIAGLLSLISAIFAKTGSVVSGLIGLALAAVFYLLWRDAKSRS